MSKEFDFETYKKQIDDIKFNIPKFETPDWFVKQTISDFPAETENITIKYKSYKKAR